MNRKTKHFLIVLILSILLFLALVLTISCGDKIVLKHEAKHIESEINQTICIEDLNVKGMIRNHKLAKSIASVSWAKFFEMLEYKAIWYGNEIRRVPTMYPSSQTCSFCGCRNPLVKNLCIRIWECPKCHTVHDRDTNAGINILKKALQMQSA